LIFGFSSGRFNLHVHPVDQLRVDIWGGPCDVTGSSHRC
jgi:hypothetical protein